MTREGKTETTNRFLRDRVSHSDMQNRNNRVRGNVGV